MELPDVETDTAEKPDPPQDLVIIGEKKEWNPIEEFWMQKLSKVEEQYEQHMVNLERSLLEQKVHRRVVSRQGNQIKKIKSQLSDKVQESDHLQKVKDILEKGLSKEKVDKSKVQEKLALAVSKFSALDKNAKVQKAELRKCNKEIGTLKRKLKRLEKEKHMLSQEVYIKEEEKSKFQEKDASLWRQKVHLMRNLKTLDTERQVQTLTNLKLNQNILSVLEDATLRDGQIHLLRRELEEAVQTMKKQRANLEAFFKQKGGIENKLNDANERVEKSRFKWDELNSQILSLKEELNYKEVSEKRQNLELKKVKNENKYLRSQLAELNQNLQKEESSSKSLHKERDRLQIELRKMKAQDVAVQNLLRQNAFLKQKLKHKISAGKLPAIAKAQEAEIFSRECPTLQIESYKTKIWELERKLGNVERNIEESQRRENMYRARMKRFEALKEQLFWTQKAMLRLEADRKSMEDMIQSFSKAMPRKIPFDKLVTDPSILDRIAKHKILQQRLATQTQKVENMKEITSFLLKNEERRRVGVAGGPTLPSNLEPWQLNYWKERSDIIPPEGGSEVKGGYYKDYMEFLTQEIPRLKNDLIQLERKKQYIRAQRATSHSRSASASVVDLDAEDFRQSSVDEMDEEEEEEEQEYEDEEEEALEEAEENSQA